MSSQQISVLVVEDEPLVRTDLAQALEKEGLRALEASNAREALACLEVSSAEIDVLFTDVDLPGHLDGMDLAQLVTELYPTIQVLVTSGHPHVQTDHLPPGRFFSKPYVSQQVIQVIREIVGEIQSRLSTRREA